MRLVTFSFPQQKRWRTGLWTEAGVIDLFSVLESMDNKGVDHQVLMMAVRSMRDIIALSQDRFLKLKDIFVTHLDQAAKSPDVLFSKQILFHHDEVSLQAPLPNPGKVLCVGMNYPSPAMQEMPDYPTIFLKPTSSIAGPTSPIVLPEIAQNVACEVELALVVGSKAHNIAIEKAQSVVFGYTIANDLGDRQIETWTSQWTSGKMFDTFTLIGPWISMPDAVSDVGSLSMQMLINGQRVQTGQPSEMLFDIPALLVHLSKLTTLYPGDLILTGSPKLLNGGPAPVVYLKPGDQVKILMEGLGEMTHFVMEER
jgi:2-keto-4-pentenoate hydratase/2-oxohepta-3-ene-1,7-dioic acid hydratase in catechol pathway